MGAMELSRGPIYEVVSAQILLGKRDDFIALHRDVLLPLLHAAHIEPFVMLMIEIGRHLRFLDIYKYPSLDEYGKRTDALLGSEAIREYYGRIGQCIEGSLQIELALEFPHATMNHPGD